MASSLRRAALFGMFVASLAVAVVLSFYKIAIANANRLFAQVPAAQALAASTPRAVGRGQWLMQVVGCRDCHGASLLGQQLLTEADGVVLSAPNLRDRAAGTPLSHDASLWRRLRLGTDDERRALWGMPRHALLGLKDVDVQAIAAAVRALPEAPADSPKRPLPQSHLTARGYLAVAWRTLWLSERDDPMAAESGWHDEPPSAGDAGLGSYLARAGHCQSCHAAGDGKDRLVLWRKKVASPMPAMLAVGSSLADWQSKWAASSCNTAAAGPEVGGATAGQARAGWPAGQVGRAQLFAPAEQAAIRGALLAAAPAL